MPMMSWILKSMDLTEMKNKKRKNKKRNKTLWPLFRNSWYSSYQPWKDERVSQTWSHLVVLNMGLLDWNTGLLNCKNLDISRTKQYFFFKQKKNRQLHIKGYFMPKNSFVVELTFKGFWINLWLFDFLYSFSIPSMEHM